MDKIILSGERLKLFPQDQGQDSPVFPHFMSQLHFNRSNSNKIIRQEKETISIQIGRKDVELSLFADDMLLNIENPNTHTDTDTHS